MKILEIVTSTYHFHQHRVLRILHGQEFGQLNFEVRITHRQSQ